jgi:hypothetical protein
MRCEKNDVRVALRPKLPLRTKSCICAISISKVCAHGGRACCKDQRPFILLLRKHTQIIKVTLYNLAGTNPGLPESCIRIGNGEVRWSAGTISHGKQRRFLGSLSQHQTQAWWLPWLRRRVNSNPKATRLCRRLIRVPTRRM